MIYFKAEIAWDFYDLYKVNKKYQTICRWLCAWTVFFSANFIYISNNMQQKAGHEKKKILSIHVLIYEYQKQPKRSEIKIKKK